MRYLIGLIGIIFGLFMIKYRDKFRNLTGTVSFAEKYLGSGGTYSFYLLLGCVIVLLSVLFATGQLQAMLTSVLTPFF